MSTLEGPQSRRSHLYPCLAAFFLLVSVATPQNPFDDVKEKVLRGILLQNSMISKAEFDSKEQSASEILIEKAYCSREDLNEGEWPALEALLTKGVINRKEFEAHVSAILEVRQERGDITQEQLIEAVERISKPKAPVKPPPPPVKPPNLKPDPDRVDDSGGEISAPPPRSITLQRPEVEPQGSWPYSPLLSRDHLRGGIGSSKQEWSPDGPQWSGSGDVVFWEGSKKLTENIFAFAEYENFHSSRQFNQDAFILGAGWDAPVNDRLGLFLKGGLARFSSDYVNPFGIVESARLKATFVGGGLRYMITEKCLGEVELWSGDNRGRAGGVSARIEWLVSGEYGVFIQSLTRAEASGLRVGVSVYF